MAVCSDLIVSKSVFIDRRMEVRMIDYVVQEIHIISQAEKRLQGCEGTLKITKNAKSKVNLASTRHL